MTRLPGTPESFWIASTLASNYPPLTEDLTVDIAIVGGGLVGITAAKQLKQAGKTVAVLEAGEIAKGTSGHTTAKVTSLHHLIYADLIEKIGEEKAQLYGLSNQAGLERLAALVANEHIDCDFERKEAYTFALSETDLDSIKAEVDAALKLGLPASFVTKTQLPFDIAGAVKFTQQAQFHPRKFILALAGTIAGDGSHVFEQTRVKTVDGETPCKVITDTGATITAQDVIIATHLPILDQGLFFAKTYPKRSYLIGAHIDAANDPQGMFIGIGDDYHSIRTTPTNDGGTMVLIGGGGHKVGEIEYTDERYRQLDAYAQQTFGVTADYRWSAQDYISFDRLPYIGKLTPTTNHIYVATGFSLWGMSTSIMSAILLSDLIMGIENPWADLYESTRPTPFISGESIKQNLDVGTHWFGDRLKGLFDSSTTLQPGEGKLITHKGKQIAAYRDETGGLHTVSAVCPHLGCIVAWNEAERSWDCPCHGSRFGYDGDILDSPAVNALQPEVISD